MDAKTMLLVAFVVAAISASSCLVVAFIAVRSLTRLQAVLTQLLEQRQTSQVASASVSGPDSLISDNGASLSFLTELPRKPPAKPTAQPAAKAVTEPTLSAIPPVASVTTVPVDLAKAKAVAEVSLQPLEMIVAAPAPTAPASTHSKLDLELSDFSAIPDDPLVATEKDRRLESAADKTTASAKETLLDLVRRAESKSSQRAAAPVTTAAPAAVEHSIADLEAMIADIEQATTGHGKPSGKHGL